MRVRVRVRMRMRWKHLCEELEMGGGAEGKDIDEVKVDRLKEGQRLVKKTLHHRRFHFRVCILFPESATLLIFKMETPFHPNSNDNSNSIS